MHCAPAVVPIGEIGCIAMTQWSFVKLFLRCPWVQSSHMTSLQSKQRLIACMSQWPQTAPNDDTQCELPFEEFVCGEVLGVMWVPIAPRISLLIGAHPLVVPIAPSTLENNTSSVRFTLSLSRGAGLLKLAAPPLPLKEKTTVTSNHSSRTYRPAYLCGTDTGPEFTFPAASHRGSALNKFEKKMWSFELKSTLPSLLLFCLEFPDCGVICIDEAPLDKSAIAVLE